MSEILGFEEACQFLKLAKPTLYGYLRRGEIPAFKMGRMWKFHKESLDQWIKDKVEADTSVRKAKRGAIK